MKFAGMETQKVPVAVLKKAGVIKEQKASDMTSDAGLLILRLAMGGLLSGHGSQKLFGWFSGPGLKGTAGWLESMGLKPGTPWATAASAGEFGGGMLTALGFLYPLGPIGTMGAMSMAIAKAHWGKPIWVTQGGAELPVTNIAAALALTLLGPGRFSLDSLLGIRLPRWVVVSAVTVEAVMLAIGIMSRPTPPAATSSEQKTTAGATKG